jgi:hypothetical protein
MRIGLVGSFKKLYDEEYIARAFEKLGHEVIRYESKESGYQQILNDNPDVVITVKRDLLYGSWGSLIGKIPTVFWLFDLYWGTPRENLIKRDWKFRSDFVFTTDSGNHDKYVKAGINHYVVRQGMIEEEAFIAEPDPKYPEEIVFVGTDNPWYPYRKELVDFLKRTYKSRFKRYGDREIIRGTELNKLYSSAKIVIGDSVPTPGYWSNRLYDVLGRGGFLIFPQIEGLDKEYIPGEHLITYKHGNRNELKEKIDIYLNQDLERERIRRQGFEHTLKNHLISNRCLQILKIIQTKIGGTKRVI